MTNHAIFEATNPVAVALGVDPDATTLAIRDAAGKLVAVVTCTAASRGKEGGVGNRWAAGATCGFDRRGTSGVNPGGREGAKWSGYEVSADVIRRRFGIEADFTIEASDVRTLAAEIKRDFGRRALI